MVNPSTSLPYKTVIGQQIAVNQLQAAATEPRHAYLLIGPTGSGKEQAALAFAASIVTDTPEDAAHAMEYGHPDIWGDPWGTPPDIETARTITAEAIRTPSRSKRRVLIVNGLDAVSDEIRATLLKTVEEPGPSTTIVLLAETAGDRMEVISSRCIRTEFLPLTAETIAAQLQTEGVNPTQAATIAEAANGNLDRARNLLNDPNVLTRAELWQNALSRMDGTGYTATLLTKEILAAIEEAIGPVKERHKAENKEAATEEKDFGLRSNKTNRTKAQEREIRYIKREELRWGFTILTQKIREALSNGDDPTSHLNRLTDLRWVDAALDRNVRPEILLKTLFSAS